MGSMTNRRWWALVALLAGTSGFALACGADGGRFPSAAPPTSARGPSQVSIVGAATTAAPTTTAPPSRFEFVDYRVTGGIAGVNDDLKVYPDGRATYQSGTTVTEFTVPSSTVADLRAALEQAGVTMLPPVNGTVTSDVFQYNVIYGGRSVRFVDGALPAPLGPAVAILNRELARGKAAR